jgi:murein DD-endopeptidase MepM/ murein hydrolase activator NlpD
MMKKSFWLTIALGLCAYLVLPMPGLTAPLSDRIQQKQHEVEQAKQKEGVLTTTIQRFSNRIDGLQGEIQSTQDRLDRAQSSLDRQKNELLEVRDRLEAARDRLARVRSELATARRLLAARLVEIYKSDTPDALTVVLESDGFSDLLERTEFMERISDQDREITDRVIGLRDQAKDQAVQLAKLEEREQLAAERILRERDQIASAQNQLLSSRDQLASARADKRGALSNVRSEKEHAMEDLASLQAEQARVAGALQAGPAPGPIKQGSGQLIWPVNGPITGVFGEVRPGHLHSGIDIAVPEGTPLRAADGGRVAIAAYTGGYGNYTCIQHTASLSTCYGHQSRFAVSVGASVTQGQVIGYSGNTGNSTGPHLHFEVRVNGTPVDPMGYL